MFCLYTTDDDRQLPTEYLPCAAITPKRGLALYTTGGKLAVASGANAAEYICMREEAAAVEAGTVIPVCKVQRDQIWQTEGTADMVVGTGYDVDTDGLKVKKSSTGAANFYITSVDGTTVRGRFGDKKSS